MRTDPSLQRKGPGRGTPPLQTLSCRQLIFAPATSLYLLTAFLTAFMSDRRDTKTVISSTYAETFALTQPAIRTPHRARFAVPSLSLQSRGSKARTLRKGDREQPCQTDRSSENAFKLSRSPAQPPAGCGTTCWSICRTSV